MTLDVSKIKIKSNSHRRKILKIINNMGKGHVGGAFSCIDLLSSLYYGGILGISPENFGDRNRNRLILSKGHASIAQYVILQDLGFFKEEELYRMNRGGILGEHPDPNIPGIETVSGSLGHGLGIGVGLSLSDNADGMPYSTYVILGDGECYEGSVWESAMLASHLNLTNLVAIIDRNGLCIHGKTEDINALEPLEDKWASFGWNVKIIDGHNIEECILSLETRHSTKPTVLIANTIKGKGVSFMENNSSWHHGSIDDETLHKALEELSL